MIYQFNDNHRTEYPETRLCRTLGVSPSGYYAWRGRPPSKREMANRELTARIKTEFEKSGQTYGSPRIYQVMRKLGLMCGKNRAAGLMRAAGLRAKQTRRDKSTTRVNKSDRAAPNRLNRDFSAERPNHKWLADITYIPTLEGWLYLAAILELFSRRIVGWAIAKRIDHRLTVEALRMALSTRNPRAGLIHHSDQGVQYACTRYVKELKDHEIGISMSAKGNPYDNAATAKLTRAATRPVRMLMATATRMPHAAEPTATTVIRRSIRAPLKSAATRSTRTVTAWSMTPALPARTGPCWSSRKWKQPR